jgi:hypothetical protein
MPYSAAIRKQRTSPIDCASDPPNLLHAGANLFLARFAPLHGEPALGVYDLPEHPLDFVGTRPPHQASDVLRPAPTPCGRPLHVEVRVTWSWAARESSSLCEKPSSEYCVGLGIIVWCIRSENWEYACSKCEVEAYGVYGRWRHLRQGNEGRR